MAGRDPSSGEQPMLALHELIFSAFKERFGEAVIGVKLTPAVHECWVTMLVKRRTPEMGALADELEQEFLEEYGKALAFNIKRPWRAMARDLIRMISRAERGHGDH
jgi:hypothetical protein